MSSWPRFVRGSSVSACAADTLGVGDASRQWSPIDSLIITDQQIGVCMWPWCTRDNRYRSSPKLRSRVFIARVREEKLRSSRSIEIIGSIVRILNIWIWSRTSFEQISQNIGTPVMHSVSPIMPVRYAMWNCRRRELARSVAGVSIRRSTLSERGRNGVILRWWQRCRWCRRWAAHQTGRHHPFQATEPQGSAARRHHRRIRLAVSIAGVIYATESGGVHF